MAEKRAQSRLAVEPEAGRIDQIGGFGQLAAQRPMGARHHRRKQFGKQRARAQRVGVGQRRAPRRRGPEVVKTALVALQSRRDLAQAHGPLQLAIEQGNKLAFGAQSPHPPVRFMLLHQPVKDIPRHRLQHTVKHAIVIRMALIPSRVRIVGETSRTEWNQCRAPCRPKLNRTAVGQIRAGKETVADIKQKDGRMLHLHEDWKRWLAFNSNNLVWIALVSGGILFTTLLMN